MRQRRFWNNVKRVGVYRTLRDSIIALIFQGKVTDERLGLIPPYGWTALAYMFNNGGYGEVPIGDKNITPEFLRASIYDIANGTARIMALRSEYIIGAYDWWFYLNGVAQGHIQASLGGKFYDRARIEAGVLELKTLLVALQLSGWPWWTRDINELEWSAFQRDYLCRFLPVKPSWEVFPGHVEPPDRLPGQ